MYTLTYTYLQSTEDKYSIVVAVKNKDITHAIHSTWHSSPVRTWSEKCTILSTAMFSYQESYICANEY